MPLSAGWGQSRCARRWKSIVRSRLHHRSASKAQLPPHSGLRKRLGGTAAALALTAAWPLAFAPAARASNALYTSVDHEIARSSLSERLAYRAQLFIASDARIRIATLASTLVALCIFAGFGFKATSPSMSIRASIFTAYSILSNVPGADVTSWHGRAAAVAQFCFFAGLVSFSLFLALVTDAVSSQLALLKHGNFTVHESGHTVIAGYNTSTEALLRQLSVSHVEGGPEVRRALRRIVVVKSEAIEDPGIDKRSQNMRIITRKADPSTESAMEKASAAQAKAVVVMDPEQFDPSERADRKVSTIMALKRSAKFRPLSLIVQRSGEREEAVDLAFEQRSLTLGSIANIHVRQSTNRILAQCAAEPGISNIFEQITTQSVNSCEVYAVSIPKRFHSSTFGQLADSVSKGTAIGFYCEPEDVVYLAPDSSSTVDAQRDSLLVLSGDSNFSFLGTTKRPNGDEPNALAQSCFEARIGSGSQPLNVVVVSAQGDSSTDVIRSLDNFLPRRSLISVVNTSEGLTSAKPKRCQLKETSSLDSIDFSKAHRIIVLNSKDANDQHVVSRLLQLSKRARVDAKFAAELNTEEGSRLAQRATKRGKLDIVNPNEVEAGMIVHALGSQASFKAVNQLLTSRGKEIHMSFPVQCPAGSTAFDLHKQAQAEGKVFCGYFIEGHGNVVLNPSKESLVPEADIRLVLISDTV